MDLESKPISRTLDFSLTSVNIVFLLLLFFLTAGTLLQDAESEIKAPNTEELPLARLPRPLLSISGEGDLFLDGKPISVEQLLATALAVTDAEEDASSSAAPLPILYVMPDRDLAANSFLGIVKTIRAAGLWNITLVTIRDNGGNGQ